MARPTKLLAALALTILLAFGSTAMAFSDISGDPAEQSILALKEGGTVSGVGNDQFVPKAKLTFAEGIHLIIKGFDFNLDHIQFIKEPQASDYFSQVDDDAWYASSFIIAQLNGLPLDPDVNPTDSLPREEFAHLLFSAVKQTGDYAFIEIYLLIEDADLIEPEHMDSIQKLLLMNAAKLDQDNRFRPDDAVTRSEAAQMLHKALQYVKKNKPISKDLQDNEVTLNLVPITDEVNKVIVSWGEKPNPGYGISIDSIEFREDNVAAVKYRLHYPIPGRMYPQVMVYPKAETYLSSSYKPVLEEIQ